MDMITLAMAKSYTDSQRIAYEEPLKTLIDMDVTEGYNQCKNTVTVVVGQVYSVTFNGVTYVCEMMIHDYGGKAIGNQSMLDGPDTGEPFFAFFPDDEGSYPTIMALENGRFTMTYSQIHTIDPKYLPGVCLPVVELSTTIENDALLTDAENAALYAAAESKMPIIIKGDVKTSGGTYTDMAAIATFAIFWDIPVFLASVGGITAEFSTVSGSWSVRLS